MSTATSNFAVVLDDEEVRNGVVAQGLLAKDQREANSHLQGTTRRTAAVIPATPAPSTATLVFRHVELGEGFLYTGVAVAKMPSRRTDITHEKIVLHEIRDISNES